MKIMNDKQDVHLPLKSDVDLIISVLVVMLALMGNVQCLVTK